MATTQSITKNLGGNRLGSGNKNNITLHAYNRSTHDLSKAWRSSMNVGTLVPFLKLVGLPGDTFSINLQALVRTIPTIGPLYGSYKLQLDVFECPIRLYNGLLHNNMTKIGLNMGQVRLPKFTIETTVYDPEKYMYNVNTSQISPSSLLNYLGIRGVGDFRGTFDNTGTKLISRTFNGVPLLAYWDIYKNYYANKQEEKGAMVENIVIQGNNVFTILNFSYPSSYAGERIFSYQSAGNAAPTTITGNAYQPVSGDTVYLRQGAEYIFHYDVNNMPQTNLQIVTKSGSTYAAVNFASCFDYTELDLTTNTIIGRNPKSGVIGKILYGIGYDNANGYERYATVKEFDLELIDQARINILQNTGLNNQLMIEDELDMYPYGICFAYDSFGKTKAAYPQQGLAIKTYQSDLLQNWLQTEWIDGANGINAITSVDTSSGSFEIDALNLANKVYNMLNRIAVSGGSYEDWQEAVYTTDANRRAESPIYRGGLAAEIVFEEVVSTAETEDSPLGSLAGKGGLHNNRGGHVEIRCSEPCYIMGIVSITPRVDYSQGNDWDVTELSTMDDLHKPALDGIGFEDLLQERAAWWGTYTTDGDTWVKLAMGKTPAWQNYMTAVNECHGDFAEEDKCMWMTLNRRYKYVAGANNKGIADLTTYIDPAKFNYTFSDASIDAQNFWVQIATEITARRVMSAKILPNL